MPTPLITNIYPAEGPSSGGNSVRFLGLNFGENPRVLFGSREGAVTRINDSLLHVTAPSAGVDPIQGGHAEVAVTISNLDDAGDLIPGEEHSVADGYAYQMPNLSAESQLTYVIRQLILEFRRQVLTETLMNQHSEYADSTSPDGDAQVDGEELVTRVAKIPSLVLLGPQVSGNQDQLQDEVTQQTIEDEWFDQLAPTIVDLSFEVLGIANTTQVGLNLLQATLEFFRRNRKLQVPCDSADDTSELVEFDLALTTFPSIRNRANDSDVVTFSGNFVIRAIHLDTIPGSNLPQGTDAMVSRGKKLADGVEISTERTGNCATANLSKRV